MLLSAGMIRSSRPYVTMQTNLAFMVMLTVN